ncbi:MAG TPA: TonB-dependent receptor [Gammaproteobacteria bacterium]|nr:TonB-dependent receptor [Gammaproteobacteria bacterium]
MMFVAPNTPASAQDEEADGLQETVVVTGSRIPRRDFSANAPIMTVDEQLFDETSLIGVETILNQMPQFVPAVTQFTTTDVQQTATNTVGVSTVSLRGLGPNRNLVLINGRRAMPVDPTMIVDTNSIPASAIARVEVISGGASAVYGADAVGGVVNFVLKDDFEGASVDIRVADTQHGGNQEITISGLLGANIAGDRGNVMLGVERATRTKQHEWQRDWKVADFANPLSPGGGFIWGGTPWINNERDFQNLIPPPPGEASPGVPYTNNLPARNQAEIATRVGWVDETPLGTVTTVDEIFSDLPAGTISNNIQAFNYRLNDDGTIFTGMGFGAQTTSGSSAPGGYRYNGPLYDPNVPGSGGDHWGNYAGLPVFVQHPWGGIKENNLYRWASSPLERLSAFANGHFEVSDNVRVTAQASVTRTQTESSLGNTAANINQWAAAVPFGNELYRGNNQPLYPGDSLDRSIYDIPDSLCELIDRDADGVVDDLPVGCTAVGTTNLAYTIDGRFGVECDAPPTPERPWLDGQPGCTNSEAWPTSAELYNLLMSRPDPNAIWWGNRSPDYLREAMGRGRSTTNTTTTMNFSLGLEGELPSGNDFWDITVSTGRSDNQVNQLGSVRLSSLRALYLVPNYGRNAQFDPEPVNDGFAENNSRCTTGLPIVERFLPSKDCVDMLAASLKNQREMTQSVLEANIVGDLAEMPAGPLQYALGGTYRENSFDFVPDNLSHNQNFLDPIAGTFPNEQSFGEYDVTEIYGELLIPIVSGGPAGVEHFNVELGGRISDWSMPNMPDLETYKALIDWAVAPRYRLRGGFNRAFRAPNLGELFITRTQVFGGFGSRDWCSQNLSSPGTFSATPADYVQGVNPGTPTAQTAQTVAICRTLMGQTGSIAYYDADPIEEQTSGGGTGVANSFGNRDLREERADTFTLGTVMDFHDNFTLTVDWYEIEIQGMISLENADSIYERCLSTQFNPSGDPTTQACLQVVRDQSDGTSQFTDRSFTNEGRALMSGVDLQLNWQRPLGPGMFSLQSVANYNLKSITQDRPDVAEEDHAGYNDCSLQIQCQRYDYRVFSQFSYAQGSWNVTLRHQYWPRLDDQDCRENVLSEDCIYDSNPTYQLFALTGGYTFADRYRLNVGIENLLDEDPPCLGFDPDAPAYVAYGGLQCTHQGGATYDPLGRRYFVSLTMDF